MSGLVERVSADLKQAMRDKDKARTGALRMIRAAFIEGQKSGKDFGDEQAVAALRRMGKQRVDAAEQYDRGGRPDLAEAERAELAVIDSYLPQLADEASTTAWVQEAIAATGATEVRQLGQVMGHLMKNHKGEIDASLARSIVQRELGG